ncbi:hypothetical protein [Plantibacter sp. T3]|uniref:hypothetical protein n=1 Tax=Plantibacter sp. T3 TaxID=2653161 RepID=UPI0012F29BE8|nr:hypothetical protein [Plantibacter sp. T3]VXB06269.1 conserved hypothetical protein [Plantibacter sp. T3]
MSPHPAGHPSSDDAPANAEDLARRKYRRRQRFLRAGQALMVTGALIGISHWLAHLGAFGPEQPPGWLDLAAGYPMAAAFLIAGAIVAGQK